MLKLIVQEMRDFSIKKLYYSISEVSKITEVEQYVLRYWESEFEELKPHKNRAGNRVYTNTNIQLILFIKKLLREKNYTIAGAKKIVSKVAKTKELSFDDVEEEKKLVESVEELLPEPQEQIVSEPEKPASIEILVEIRNDIEQILRDYFPERSAAR